MRGVIVDPASRVARVLGGSLLGDVDHATPPVRAGAAERDHLHDRRRRHHARRRARPPHPRRRADDRQPDRGRRRARRRPARAHQRVRAPDLFWALRGGGGNFGVVVSFSFSLREVADVLAGPTLWPMEAAPAVMRAFDTLHGDAPDIVGGFFLFLEVPPDPSFPAELHGQRMCGDRLVRDRPGRHRRLRRPAGRRAAGAARRAADAVPGVELGLRRPLSARAPVVLARGLLRRADRRGDRRALRARRAAADDAVEHAPVPDQRRGRRGSARTPRRGPTATRSTGR